MTQESSEICFYRNSARCRDIAVVHVFCYVEGRDTHFCRSHWNEWSQTVRGDELLAKHCPRCAPAYLARREAQAHSNNTVIADEPITGPLAEAIDRAMHAEGILEPVRQRIMRRLAADTDSYVAAVMARQSGSVL